MTDMQIYRALGRAVARRRKELALTQADVARQIGLTRASLANIESGRQKVLLHQVYRLAGALRLDSILGLTAPSFVIGEQADKPLTFTGSPVTPKQQARIEAVIERVLRQARRKSMP
jgi:transcriptional regulator with XRE-family HTH domain